MPFWFFFFFQPWSLPYQMVLPTFRMGPLTYAKPLWKRTPRHTKSLASWLILKPVRLTVNHQSGFSALPTPASRSKAFLTFALILAIQPVSDL